MTLYEASGSLSHFEPQSSSTSEVCDLTQKVLTAVINWRGYSSRNRPLQLQQLQDTNAQSYSYLAFCERKSQPSEELELVESKRWFDGKGSFYIKCSTEPDTTSEKSSYLCVQRKTSWRRQVTYSTGCVPSIKHHNRQGRSMLFKLVRAFESGAKDAEIQNRAKNEQRVVIDGESATLNKKEIDTCKF